MWEVELGGINPDNGSHSMGHSLLFTRIGPLMPPIIVDEDDSFSLDTTYFNVKKTTSTLVPSYSILRYKIRESY